MVPIHPGRILRRELKACGLSANALARALRVPSGRIVDILTGKRAVTAETALRLGRYFGDAPPFWPTCRLSTTSPSPCATLAASGNATSRQSPDRVYRRASGYAASKVSISLGVTASESAT